MVRKQNKTQMWRENVKEKSLKKELGKITKRKKRRCQILRIKKPACSVRDEGETNGKE